MDLLQQERPLKPPFPDAAHWSENYCLSGFDTASGVGFWLHMGRWRKDLTLWRETLVVLLPDGTTLAHRNVGNALTTDDGPGGGNFQIRVLEDGRALAYHYHGAMRRLTQENMRAGVCRDGARERVAIELRFQSDAEIWDLHKVGARQEFLGAGHIEQIGAITGAIELGGERVSINCKGNRDHSMGPRNTVALLNHQWLQAYFENDVSVLVYDAILRDHEEPVFCEAAVYEGGKLYNGRLHYPWRIDNAADYRKPFGFSVDYENGRLDVQSAEIKNTAFLSFTAPNDLYVGVMQKGDKPLTLLEQSATLLLNGTIAGYGHFERTVPGEIMCET